jgi:hypothetical protein
VAWLERSLRGEVPFPASPLVTPSERIAASLDHSDHTLELLRAGAIVGRAVIKY